LIPGALGPLGAPWGAQGVEKEGFINKLMKKMI